MPLPVIPIKPPYLPELLPEVVAYIENILPDGAHVFEFGSGASTVWFAETGCLTISVEHEPAWANEVERTLGEAGVLYRAEVILVGSPDAIPVAIDDYAMFDMVFVDCYSTKRQQAIARSVSHVRPGGYMVVDDSHWGGVAKGINEHLGGWERKDISGMHTRKTGSVRPHQTSILRRPNG